MAKTIRVQILEEMRDKLKASSAIKTVRVQEFSQLDIAKLALPLAFIWPETEIRNTEVTHSFEHWTMTVAVEIWGKSMDLENILGTVHKLLYADRTRGGLAIDTKRVGSELLGAVDPEKSLASVVVRFDIGYRHVPGDPYS